VDDLDAVGGGHCRLEILRTLLAADALGMTVGDFIRRQEAGGDELVQDLIGRLAVGDDTHELFPLRVGLRERRQPRVGTPRLEGPRPRGPGRLERRQHRLQRHRRLVARGETLGGVLPQAPPHHRLHRRRHLRVQRHQARRLVPQDGRQDLRRRQAPKRTTARQKLVKHRPQGKHVGPRPRRLPLHLLGRHVPDRPQEHARRRVLRRRGARGVGVARHQRLLELGQPEVEDLHPAFLRQEHVLGLEVAVDDAPLVSRAQAPGRLQHPAQRLAQRRDPAPQGLAQGLALEELEDQVGVPLVVPHVEDGDDVGVDELGRGTGLGLEAVEPLGGRRPLGRDELHGDGAAEAGVVGAVHLAHPARADQVLDLVGAELGFGGEGHRLTSTVIPRSPDRTGDEGSAVAGTEDSSRDDREAALGMTGRRDDQRSALGMTVQSWRASEAQAQ
jgi:hypothetical protein